MSIHKHVSIPAYVGGVTGITFRLVIHSITHGYALSVFWKWFVVSTFGIPPISIASGIGIALIITTLVTIKADLPDREIESYGNLFLKTAISETLKPGLALAFGAIIYSLM